MKDRIIRNRRGIYRILVILIIIAPFVESIFFSVTSKDDFSMFIRDVTLAKAIDKANYFWHSWGGGWPYILIECLLNPLNFASPRSHMTGFVLIIMFCIFVTVFGLMIKALLSLKSDGEQNDSKWFPIYALLLAAVLNSDVYPEIFYWFVGNSYLWGNIFIMTNIIAIVWYSKKPESVLRGAVLSVVGFVACFNTVLAVSAGLVYLFLVTSTVIKERHFEIKCYITRHIPLAFMVLGGLVSTLAPGNYTRHGYIDDTGLHFKDALITAFNNTVSGYINVIDMEIIVVVMLIILLIGMRTDSIRSSVNPAWLWMSGFIASLGVMFPLALGYSSGAVPNRMLFELNSTIIPWMGFSMYYTGKWLAEHDPKRFWSRDGLRLPIIAMSIFSVILMMSRDIEGNTAIKKLPWSKTILTIGSVIEESNFYRNILAEIEESDEESVVIQRRAGDYPVQTGVVMDLELTDAPDHWVNEAVKNYYGKSAIVYKVIE